MKEPKFYEDGPYWIAQKYGLDGDFDGNIKGLSEHKREYIVQEVWDSSQCEDGFRCWECEDEGCEECEDLPDNDSIDGMTLQDILDKIPEGITPKDVVINHSMRARYASVEITLSFSYQPILDFKTQKKLYDADMKVYNKKWEAHLKEKEKYDNWVKEQEKEKLRARLEELEGGA